MENAIFRRRIKPHLPVRVSSQRRHERMMNFSGIAPFSLKVFLVLILSASLCGILGSNTAIAQSGAKQRVFSKAGSSNPDSDIECRRAGPKGCVRLAIDAMGGQVRLERTRSLGVEAVRHTFLTEQSYRQDPFITSYERLKVKVDFAGSR